MNSKHAPLLIGLLTSISVLHCPLTLASGNDPIRVSVLKFKDRSARGASYRPGCHGFYIWADSLGDAFSDLLVERLGANPKLEVLERDAIDDVYEKEVALVNSDADHSVKKEKFKKARITFVGVVDSFEYCESGNDAALNVGRLFGVGDITPSLKTSKASVSILIRAIDTTSGKVLATARAKKEQSKRSVHLNIDLDRVDFRGADFRESPLGGAIQGAVSEAGDTLLTRLRI